MALTSAVELLDFIAAMGAGICSVIHKSDVYFQRRYRMVHSGSARWLGGGNCHQRYRNQLQGAEIELS